MLRKRPADFPVVVNCDYILRIQAAPAGGYTNRKVLKYLVPLEQSPFSLARQFAHYRHINSVNRFGAKDRPRACLRSGFRRKGS
jgi:hypothetical protein